ncbi:hypothetical protein PROH_15820 [Prochlorothrix hollandica PCC 9006 = CALU 1027]|uniref:Uncharacterized protein n=1 Tax=Prochlorothrix hollandica PCC 9006 = CALU 1027 TaxID=317619 RepID=A0A0M2PSW5_PROHO|nr:hypothetical protein PROH_15820 [Prochlorothrix hollandica PCC 9006 = CALU 1027]
MNRLHPHRGSSGPILSQTLTLWKNLINDKGLYQNFKSVPLISMNKAEDLGGLEKAQITLHP